MLQVLNSLMEDQLLVDSFNDESSILEEEGGANKEIKLDKDLNLKEASGYFLCIIRTYVVI